MEHTIDLYRQGLDEYVNDRRSKQSNVFSLEKLSNIKHRLRNKGTICKYCKNEPDGLAFPPKSGSVYRCMCSLGEKSKYERYLILGPVQMEEWDEA